VVGSSVDLLSVYLLVLGTFQSGDQYWHFRQTIKEPTIMKPGMQEKSNKAIEVAN